MIYLLIFGIVIPFILIIVIIKTSVPKRKAKIEQKIIDNDTINHDSSNEIQKKVDEEILSETLVLDELFKTMSFNFNDKN